MKNIKKGGKSEDLKSEDVNQIEKQGGLLLLYSTRGTFDKSMSPLLSFSSGGSSTMPVTRGDAEKDNQKNKCSKTNDNLWNDIPSVSVKRLLLLKR